MNNWRLLDTGYLNAAENMALDDIILELKSKKLTPDTLRILRFKPPAVLVGYHQDVEHEVRLEYVAEKGIDVNRRITGGGAIYFDETSIGWEIIASKKSIPKYGNIEELFKMMCRGAIKALKILGINALYRPKNDIEVKGRKISGTGGTERGDAVLFQGTLLVDFDVETMIKALRIPVVKLKDKELSSVRDRVTSLREELGYTPEYEEIKKALKRGFEEEFGISIREGSLTILERKILKQRLPYFKSKNWIFLNRRHSKKPAMSYSVAKKAGGLIKVSLALDKEARVIKSVLITGDFFIFPRRAIYDLESRLKFTYCSRDEIENTVYTFFREKNVVMPGISPEDIVELILEAIDKISFEEYGLDHNEVNNIFFVTKNAKKVMQGECDYLLLPYCAKYVFCKYRKREGCIKCGKCTIGEAYKLAEEAGLTPVTIQNFEHLMKIMNLMKKRRAKGFIGCCCEAFYQKHRDDLEKIGIPGLIINIENKTCYELGKQEEAYSGDFNIQTSLRINTLSKILHQIKIMKGF